MKAIDNTTIKIIALLTVIANDVFNALDLEPGTYTAAELAANVRRGDKAKRPIYSPEDIDPAAMATVTADGFACEFPRPRVFDLIEKFEKLAKPSSKAKTRFTREAEAGTVFYIDIPKNAANAANFVETLGGRYYNCEHILLDITRAALVASNAYILTEIPVTIEGAVPVDLPSLYIDPKHIRQLTGRVKVNVIEDAVIYTNEAGAVFKNDLNKYRFPDYGRAYSNTLSKAGYIRFTPDAIKVAQKLFRSCSKSSDAKITLTVDAGANVANFAYADTATKTTCKITLQLAAPAAADIAVCLDPELLTRALSGWDGGLWYTSPSRPVYFDVKDTRAVMVFPVLLTTVDAHPEIKGDIKALDRLNALATPVTVEISDAPTQHPETITQAAPQPATVEASDAPTQHPETITQAARPVAADASDTPTQRPETIIQAAPQTATVEVSDTPTQRPDISQNSPYRPCEKSPVLRFHTFIHPYIHSYTHAAWSDTG